MSTNETEEMNRELSPEKTGTEKKTVSAGNKPAESAKPAPVRQPAKPAGTAGAQDAKPAPVRQPAKPAGAAGAQSAKPAPARQPAKSAGAKTAAAVKSGKNADSSKQNSKSSSKKKKASSGETEEKFDLIAVLEKHLKKRRRKKAAKARRKAEEARRKEAEKAALSPKEVRKIKRRRRKTIWRVVRRVLLCLFTVLLLAVFGVYMVLNEVFRGPSQTAGDYLAISLMESSAGKFVPYLYYSAEEVAQIQERNKVVELTDITNTDLITIETPTPPEEGGEETKPEDDIIVETITGPTYRGWMMIVKDPSRVSLGVSSDKFSYDRGGMRIGDIAEKYNAVAAINGGAFSDGGGQGNGGMPEGLTVADGKICVSVGGDKLVTAGFTNENVLVVGKMTKKDVEKLGIRDAVSFGPALIVNGEQAEVAGVSSGLNPRTAIGQRADGAVLMLVIDGRQVNSLGASMADLVEIMARYGAVNACNLDGGSSSNMIYEGEMLNDGVAVTGSRRIPTAFIVR